MRFTRAFFILCLQAILFSLLNAAVDAKKRPKDRKTNGSLDCALHVPEVVNSVDVDDDKVRLLYKKCKPNARKSEVDDSIAFLHELQEEEKKNKAKKDRKASRQIKHGNMEVVSRQTSFTKHAKSYGTTDVKSNEPFVYGEWYFKFDTGTDSGIVTGSHFPAVKVLASGSEKKCRWMLFFTCILPYIESHILVQSTAERCYNFLIWTRCEDKNHQVYFKYTNANPETGGTCACRNECSRCLGA